MRCFHPLRAWQLDGGEIVFKERGSIRRELSLRCGRCVGCRLARSVDWAIRCCHEASLYEANSFVTLTYRDELVPVSLCYRDFWLFMRRLRKAKPGVRFFMCGEYGEKLARPHFHACLFNCRFQDAVEHSRTAAGFCLYRSAELERIWPFGFSTIADVTFETAAYVARYVCKKVTGDLAAWHYRYVTSDGEVLWKTPEFCRMSLKPGVGAGWYARFNREVFGRDGALDRVVLEGHEMSPPKYYDKLCKAEPGQRFDEVEYQRALRALSLEPDNSPERLAVQESVALARLALKGRKLC